TVACLTVVMVLLLLAGPAAPQIPVDKLIVPGQRVGKWTLEMTIIDLVRMNGPATIDSSGGLDHITPVPRRYRWGTLYASTRDGQRVEFFLIFDDATFKTEKNIGGGSNRTSVQSAYGTPTAETKVSSVRTRMIYDVLGFAALIESDQVVGVNVFRPGTGKSIWSF
ncbi:MAG TPA: hypothetical protein VFT63_06275, partial [bacterium]|nr:hypothetical protein [bacterium]